VPTFPDHYDYREGVSLRLVGCWLTLEKDLAYQGEPLSIELPQLLEDDQGRWYDLWAKIAFSPGFRRLERAWPTEVPWFPVDDPNQIGGDTDG
jgi:hypothetical protein